MRWLVTAMHIELEPLTSREGVIGAPAIMQWLVTTMHIEFEPLTSREGSSRLVATTGDDSSRR
jgi:hypothetical protein